MSNYTTILWGLFLILMSLTISYASKIFSIMLLPFTNPDWFLKIIFVSTVDILSKISLEKILFTKLQRLIDQKFSNCFTLSFFGMRTRLVWVINLGSWNQQKIPICINISTHNVPTMLIKYTNKPIRSPCTYTIKFKDHFPYLFHPGHIYDGFILSL